MDPNAGRTPRQQAHRYWNILVAAVFVAVFVVPPTVEWVIRSIRHDAAEQEERLRLMPEHMAHYRAVLERIKSQESYTPDEYVQDAINIIYFERTLNLNEHLPNMMTGKYPAHTESIVELQKKFCTWAMEKDEELLAMVKMYKELEAQGRGYMSPNPMGTEENRFFYFINRSGCFSKANEQVRQSMGPNWSPEDRKTFLFGTGKFYLKFLPFALLLVLGNLLFSREPKKQLVFGWRYALLSTLLGPFAAKLVGNQDFFTKRLRRTERDMFPQKSYWDLTPEERELAVIATSQPLKEVDRAIWKGKLALMILNLLTLISAPVTGFCQKAKADDSAGKKEKKEIVKESSAPARAGEMAKSAPPKAGLEKSEIGQTGVHQDTGYSGGAEVAVCLTGNFGYWPDISWMRGPPRRAKPIKMGIEVDHIPRIRLVA